mmetsp:Transcript_57215/g.100153  ORF Transcript_57215/g.100153 Transcript_57215/m.100153 type:complete len:304 (-) Transcript_57215:92-1003(-)
MAKELLGPHPQGCFIKLFIGDKEEMYELHSISYVLHPTGVAVCTYNTPKNMNPISLNQRWETMALLEHMTRDEKVRVVIWTGSGRAFNAGADLSGNPTVTIPKHAMEDMKARRAAPDLRDMVMAVETKAFWDFPKPSISAVNGITVGGAVNIAIAGCHDMVICSSEARFMYPFPKLGFTPELGSSFMLPYLVGMVKAKELFFLSDWLSAEQAKELGLVNKLVAPEELMPEAMKLAERLCLLHPSALKMSKRIVNSHIRSQLDQILAAEQAAIMECLKETGGPPKVQSWMKSRAEEMQQLKAKL